METVADVAIWAIQEAIKLAPGLIQEFQTLFASGDPTDADFVALKARITAKSYADYDPTPIPANVVPLSPQPAISPAPAQAVAELTPAKPVPAPVPITPAPVSTTPAPSLSTAQHVLIASSEAPMPAALKADLQAKGLLPATPTPDAGATSVTPAPAPPVPPTPPTPPGMSAAQFADLVAKAIAQAAPLVTVAPAPAPPPPPAPPAPAPVAPGQPFEYGHPVD